MSTTRRTFLQVIGTSTSALALVCPLPSCGSEKRDVAAGDVDDFDDGLTILEGEGVIVGRDEDGLYAMTAICTHLQCDMSDGNSELDGDVLRCTCHGSEYDLEGANQAGPARAPLEHYAVEIAADGAVTIKVGSIVDAGVRTEAPA